MPCGKNHATFRLRLHLLLVRARIHPPYPVGFPFGSVEQDGTAGALTTTRWHALKAILATEQRHGNSGPDMQLPPRLMSLYVVSLPPITLAISLHISATSITSAYNFLLRRAHILRHRKIVMNMCN